MSSDNGIFIFDHPHGYGVCHETLSNMPYCLSDVIKSGRSSLEPVIGVYQSHNLAMSAAMLWQRLLLNNQYILEYGICDYSNPERKFRPGILARSDGKLPKEIMQYYT